MCSITKWDMSRRCPRLICLWKIALTLACSCKDVTARFPVWLFLWFAMSGKTNAACRHWPVEQFFACLECFFYFHAVFQANPQMRSLEPIFPMWWKSIPQGFSSSGHFHPGPLEEAQTHANGNRYEEGHFMHLGYLDCQTATAHTMSRHLWVQYRAISSFYDNMVLLLFPWGLVLLGNF